MGARIYKDGRKIETVKSIPLYSVINGFWINETGNLEIIQIQTAGLVRYWVNNFSHNVHRLHGYPFYDWRREKGDGWAKKIERKLKEVLRRK